MNFGYRHSRFLLSLFAVLAIAGAACSLWLPVALFPQLSFPRIRIDLEAGDRPAERMAIEVTTPVEESVRSIPGVRTLRSTTSRGSAEIFINFDWGEEMIAALLQVESQINKILPTLPSGTAFNVIRMDPTVFPVIAYSITSDRQSLSTLRDLAQYTLRPALATVPGVSQVGVQGGQIEEYRVVLDPAKIQSFGMTFNDVANALSASSPRRFSGVQKCESGFMPTMDEGGFIIDYRAPPGTSLAETDRLVRQVEAMLHTLPEVQTSAGPRYWSGFIYVETTRDSDCLRSRLPAAVDFNRASLSPGALSPWAAWRTEK